MNWGPFLKFGFRLMLIVPKFYFYPNFCRLHIFQFPWEHNPVQIQILSFHWSQKKNELTWLFLNRQKSVLAQFKNKGSSNIFRKWHSKKKYIRSYCTSVLEKSMCGLLPSSNYNIYLYSGCYIALWENSSLGHVSLRNMLTLV